MADNEGHDLVVVIVNTGYADEVMIAAREAGARGGSIIHCRGTSNRAIEKKFGVYVTPEKEMVLIVVKTSIRDTILERVYQALGNDGKGKCVAFSLPVSNLIGINDGESK